MNSFKLKKETCIQNLLVPEELRWSWSSSNSGFNTVQIAVPRLALDFSVDVFQSRFTVNHCLIYVFKCSISQPY